MSHTATTEKDTTTVRDGWSRDDEGVLTLDEMSCFRLFSAFIAGSSPSYAYALNLIYERGMDYDGFKAKNAIRTLAEAS